METSTDTIHQVTELIQSGEIDQVTIQQAIVQLLTAIGENPEREGLKNTPERVARMYSELLAGYWMDPEEIVNDALFDLQVHYNDMCD